MYKSEFAFLGMESVQTDETTHDICNGGGTSTLSFSVENCVRIVNQENVNINLAQGRVVMVTTHEAMKTFYFRTRTGEFRGITTKTFIIPG